MPQVKNHGCHGHVLMPVIQHDTKTMGMGTCPWHRIHTSLVILLAIIAGCQSAHESHPLDAKLFAGDDDTQLEFWHTLATRKLATNDEAFHGLLLYLDSADTAKDYDARVKLLKSRHMLESGFAGSPDDAATRGTLAVPIARALEIRGGLLMHLTGPTPRYATRELQYLGLYPPSSPNQIFSGAEFVGIIGKLDDYQHGNPVPVTQRLSE